MRYSFDVSWLNVSCFTLYFWMLITLFFLFSVECFYEVPEIKYEYGAPYLRFGSKQLRLESVLDKHRPNLSAIQNSDIKKNIYVHISDLDAKCVAERGRPKMQCKNVQSHALFRRTIIQVVCIVCWTIRSVIFLFSIWLSLLVLLLL